MKIIIIVCFMLATSLQCCFGRTDANLLVAGDWSVPVRDGVWPLRGRLLVYNAVADKENGIMEQQAKLYLELQLVTDRPMARRPLVGVFTDKLSALGFEMHDGNDKRIYGKSFIYNGIAQMPASAILAPDSTLRTRVDMSIRRPEPKPVGLLICVPVVDWIIPPGTTNDYYLTATYFHPTNNQLGLDYHVWQGTLQLPKVKIPTEKIRK